MFALPLAMLLSTSASSERIAVGPSFRFGDYDRDGRLDVYVVDSRSGDRLLRNMGDGIFADVTTPSGVAGIEASRVALWEDIDRDGWLDLYVGAAKGPSRVLRNMGDGTFADLSTSAGLTPPGAGVVEARFLNLDGDSLPDLHEVTELGDRLWRNRGTFVFEFVDLGAISVDAPVPFVPGVSTSGPGSLLAPPPPGTTVTPAGSHAPAAAAPACPETLRDQGTGLCLDASSTPTLGKLYPLSTSLNVSPGGDVGVGTTTPGAKLDIVGTLRAREDRIIR